MTNIVHEWRGPKYVEWLIYYVSVMQLLRETESDPIHECRHKDYRKNISLGILPSTPRSALLRNSVVNSHLSSFTRLIQMISKCYLFHGI